MRISAFTALLALVSSLSAFAEDAVPPNGRTAFGGEGLSRVGSALFAPRTLSISAHGGWFSASEFSVLGGAEENYSLALGAAVAPIKWLEVSVSTRSSAHFVSYEVQGSQGRSAYSAHDARGNIKAGGRLLGDTLGLAVEVGARVPPPQSGAASFSAQLSPHVRGLVSYQLKPVPVPVRLHLNAGYLWDRSATQATLADPGRRFTYDSGAFNRLQAGLGAEAHFRVAMFGLSPFLEYTLEVPLGAPEAFAAAPMRVTPGVRLFAGRGFYAQGTADIGITRRSESGVVPVPSVMGGIALGYGGSFDGARVVEKEVVREVVLKAPPTHGVLRGVVKDGASQAPLADAAIAVPGRSRVLTDSSGVFELPEVPAGPVELRADHAGYATATANATVAPGGAVDVEVLLSALPPPPPAAAFLKGSVITEADKEVAATFSVPTAGIRDQAVPKGGEFRLELPAGEHTVEASAKGHLAQGRRITVAPGETLLADFVLKPMPKRTLVILKKEKIEIKKQVHFATGKAVILPDSAQLLDEVAAVILENEGITKIRIEGHTDDQGDDVTNLTLSDRRAAAVMSALIQRGVDPARLVAVGFGETTPIAPNKTPKGRASNRRVEFMIAGQQ